MNAPEAGMTWDVAIVGGGASGALLAAHLLRAAPAALRVVLVEARGPHGEGVAYGTPDPWHVLNVPAGKMSAFPADPQHFLRWLRGQVAGASEGDFAPRHRYGEYLQALLKLATGASFHLELLRGEVTRLACAQDGVTLFLAAATPLRARVVVLATGHDLSKPLPVPDGGLYESARFIASPWDPLFQDIPRDEGVLLLGTGLSMVDAALTLAERGHRGHLHALSRHGLLPMAHRMGVSPVEPTWTQRPSRLAQLMRDVRETARGERAAGGDWRAVVDGLRPLSRQLWQGLSATDQRRFLRHARAYWDIHRHRMAPEVAEKLGRLQARGQLSLHSGRVREFKLRGERVRARYRPRGHAEEKVLEVDRVVNCMGPSSDVRQSDSPLLQQLLRDGLVRPDSLELGLDANDDGELLGRSGSTASRLFALGPLLRGLRWESTAIPEIRAQAEALAAHLVRELGHSTEIRPGEGVSP